MNIKTNKTSDDIVSAALRYAEQGLPVFPCKPEDKAPLTKHGFKDATTDADTIRRWWKRRPNALIAVPTGAISGIAVADLDNKNGKDGFAAVPDWEQRTPVIARTRSGGAHLYFQAAGAPRCSESEIAPGVDTRGDGGYVIVPPSPGYQWMNGSDLSALPPWPDDLRPPARTPQRRAARNREANPALVAAALAVIPNDDLGWGDWNCIGMATWAATGGSAEGLAAFTAWSAKSKKHDADATDKRWQHYAKSPPNEIGAGTLFHEASEDDPNWRGALFPDLTKNGRPRPTLLNTKIALSLLGIECRHNLFSLCYEVGGHIINEFAGEIHDPAIHELRSLIRDGFWFEPGKQMVLDAVHTLANQHRYHPVRDYLNSLQWDGVPRIDKWAITYCGAEEDEFNCTVGGIALVACVRRVRQPGVKFDEMVVFESPEGKDKSSMLQALAVKPEWFSDQMD